MGWARDIERHLNNQPIVARPPSNLYRLQKLVQRNKAAFAAATSISLLLVAATAVSTWLALRAKRAERRVVAQLGIDGRIFKRQAIQITDLGRDEAMWRDILAEERKLWGDDPQFLEFLEGAVRNLADALQRQG